jgi:hypothetical protein
MLTITFAIDQENDGIEVRHDGRQVFWDNARDGWTSYFQRMPRGVPVLLEYDNGDLPELDRPPERESTDTRLARWLVDNNDNPDIRLDSEEEDDGPVTISKAELGFLLYSVAERMYWHGVDDVRATHGLQ